MEGGLVCSGLPLDFFIYLYPFHGSAPRVTGAKGRHLLALADLGTLVMGLRLGSSKRRRTVDSLTYLTCSSAGFNPIGQKNSTQKRIYSLTNPWAVDDLSPFPPRQYHTLATHGTTPNLQ